MKIKAVLLSILDVGLLQVLSCVAVAATLQSLAQPASALTCPDPPPPTIASSQPPGDVCIPSRFSGNPIAFFDDYSWRAFIAMVWPAEQGQRGVPDPSKAVGLGSGPLVFETFKADWEVFQPDGHAPSPWGHFGDVPTNPCVADITTPGPNDLILASVSKFQNLGEAGFGNLVGPLVAQNKTYVRYMTSFNQLEFNKILGEELFLRTNLANGVTFPDGSIDVKTSWIDMTNVSNPERFYTRKAWLMDLTKERCSQATVGLVGMHIVQKTPSRSQWIWSSFEHVDNVPQPTPQNIGPATFNAGNGQPMPQRNPIAFPPPVTPPAPFNVDRVKPINPSTMQTNAAYRNALKDTVWAHYELVMTQWPLTSDPNASGMPANTFPGTSDQSSAFANTTLETFEQGSVFNSGCMRCHTLVQRKTDFLWSLEINAFPVPASTLAVSSLGAPHAMALRATPGSAALRDLKSLLETATAPSTK
jgi:hypothetical protein